MCDPISVTRECATMTKINCLSNFNFPIEVLDLILEYLIISLSSPPSLNAVKSPYRDLTRYSLANPKSQVLSSAKSYEYLTTSTCKALKGFALVNKLWFSVAIRRIYRTLSIMPFSFDFRLRRIKASRDDNTCDKQLQYKDLVRSLGIHSMYAESRTSCMEELYKILDVKCNSLQNVCLSGMEINSALIDSLRENCSNLRIFKARKCVFRLTDAINAVAFFCNMEEILLSVNEWDASDSLFLRFNLNSKPHHSLSLVGVPRSYGLDPAIIREILSKNANIQQINIHHANLSDYLDVLCAAGPNLRSVIVSGQASFAQIERILESFTYLKSFDIHDMFCVELSSDSKSHLESITSIIPKFPHARFISNVSVNCDQVPQFEVNCLLNHLSSLQYLKITVTSVSVLIDSLPALERLISLDLRVTTGSRRYDGFVPSHLKNRFVREPSPESIADVVTIIKSLKRLEWLQMVSVRIDKSVIECMANQRSALKYVDITKCMLVSSLEIGSWQELFRRQNCLRVFYLNGLDNAGVFVKLQKEFPHILLHK
ncbi:hypothetical protein HK098_004952 [Nowakowskiella sp. JEL0407]|nr:hypothetical protein HK098_004952 [Nowakowskiella sp. JEL0407]